MPAFIDNMAAHDKGVDSTSTSCLGQVRSPRDYQTTITNTDYVTLAHFITLLQSGLFSHPMKANKVVDSLI